jgi:drug/metabolite transporter (DMT)-like permease
VASRSAGLIWLSVAGALAGFAANSLLTRAAVGRHLIDPVSFSEVRLATGALTLLALQRLRGAGAGGGRFLDGLIGAAALGVYAFAFAFAYSRIDAGTGALVLFGGVQLTMLTWSVVSGERSGTLEWIGLATAVAGLVVLTNPGITAPDQRGAALMAAAGATWGIYTLRGRGAGDPLARTAASFLWAAVAGAAVMAVHAGGMALSSRGVILAAISGAIASGIGYTLWYLALPSLTAFRAALLQLMVPVLTALTAIPLLGERISARLVWASALVLGGIAIAALAKARPHR